MPARLSTNWATTAGDVLGMLLAGLTTVNASAVTSGDSIVAALGKLQAQFNVEAVNVKWYGAKGDNATNDTTALQSALTAGAGRTVVVPSGTYLISSPLAPSANTRLVLDPGATIKQVASANSASLINCSANAANGFQITGGTLDGNLAGGNTTSTYGVNIGTANDVTVSGVKIQNTSDCCVYVYSGLRPTITNNLFTNTRGYGCVMVAPPSAQTATYGVIADNRFVKPFGAHAVYIQNADNFVIHDNFIQAQQVTGMTVSVSGTAITSAGTGVNNFLTNTDGGPIQVGSFIILGDGTSANSQNELLVTAVNSASSLTVSAPGGTHSNFSAIAGPGDLISVSCGSFLTIQGNRISGGSAGGIVVSDFTGGESLQDNQIDGNDVRSIGNCGISIQTTTSSYQAFNNSITNNVITNCGVGGNATTYNVGIALAIFGTDALFNCFVAGNLVSNIGGGNTQYWMQVTAPAGSYIMCGDNATYGMANPGILGGISSIVLSAGWGSTASVSGIVSQGKSFKFTITSGGTGQAASPTITINTVATTPEQPGIIVAIMAGGTGAVAAILGEFNTGPGSMTLVYNGTPVAGSTYVIYGAN